MAVSGTPGPAGARANPQASESALVDEETLKRWMNLEIYQTNQATVTRARHLTELLAEEEPTAEARDGSIHAFEPAVLEELAEALSPLARVELKLPITVYLSHKAANDCYVADDAAIEALHQLGVTDIEPREGKLWIGTPLARRFAKDWPGVVQFLIT